MLWISLDCRLRSSVTAICHEARSSSGRRPFVSKARNRVFIPPVMRQRAQTFANILVRDGTPAGFTVPGPVNGWTRIALKSEASRAGVTVANERKECWRTVRAFRRIRGCNAIT